MKKTSLNQRSETVLRTLIEAYLVTGEPVGSRLLATRFPEPLSSATIRSVLADLEASGFVSQPHTSAGRLPTERAYRYYVDRWVRPSELRPELGKRLEAALAGRDQDPDQWLRHASRVLSDVMGGVCVALPVRFSRSRLARLEFIALAPSRLVVVWVGNTGEVEHQAMENAWGFDESTLRELGNFATAHFRGCTLHELRSKLLGALKNWAGEARDLRERLAAIASRMTAIQEETAEPGLVVSGLGGLVRLPDFEDLDRFRTLVAAFEEHERLARLLNAFAQAAAEEVQLLLGSENPYLESMPLATALRTIALGPDTRVTFALVGPMRTDYAKLLGGLNWWSGELLRQNLRAARPFGATVRARSAII